MGTGVGSEPVVGGKVTESVGERLCRRSAKGSWDSCMIIKQMDEGPQNLMGKFPGFFLKGLAFYIHIHILNLITEI